MSDFLNKKTLTAALLISLLLAASVQAASNPFAEARPDSRLPAIAGDTSEKCAGMASDNQGEGGAMMCGPGKCGASMMQGNKPDAAPTQDASGSAMPAKQCGGGAKCGGGGK